MGGIPKQERALGMQYKQYKAEALELIPVAS